MCSQPENSRQKNAPDCQREPTQRWRMRKIEIKGRIKFT